MLVLCPGGLVGTESAITVVGTSRPSLRRRSDCPDVVFGGIELACQVSHEPGSRAWLSLEIPLTALGTQSGTYQGIAPPLPSGGGGLTVGVLGERSVRALTVTTLTLLIR